MINRILIQTHRPVVWFQVLCFRERNEIIIDLFPTPNIHHPFKNLKWGVALIKRVLLQTHLAVVWFQVLCFRQHNEIIIDLFPTPNIHHPFIKLIQNF